MPPPLPPIHTEHAALWTVIGFCLGFVLSTFLRAFVDWRRMRQVRLMLAGMKPR